MGTELRQIRNRREEIDALTAVIAESALSGPVRILEAGCGHHWPIDLDGVERQITGVDLDADALRIRRDELHDLDEEILGDLQTVRLPQESFDVVYCSFVLEHVEGAESALTNLYRALRPGGAMIIKVPDGDSVYGFLTKHSPHRAHVWYKRYIEGHPNAGKPGHAPYPTVYDEVVSIRGLHGWARRHGMRVHDEYCSNSYLRAFGPLRPVAQAAVNAMGWLSGGRLAADHNNIGMVLVKEAPAA